LRIELDPSYFRAKQRELWLARKVDDGEPEFCDEEIWKTFVAIVDLFQEHKVRLVVCELEYAPFAYPSVAERSRCRGFMNQVRSYLENRGIAYIRVDWDRFTDADYFDSIHFNSNGVERFMLLVVEQLRPLLGARKAGPSSRTT